jgi:hypothetical protein
MHSLTKQAMLDYNGNIESIRKAAEGSDIDTIVTTVKCGVGAGYVERELVNSSVTKLKPIIDYKAEGQTPLFDSVGELVEILEKVPDANSLDVSFLIMAITDGEENYSKRYSADKLAKLIRDKQATDRWTFAFRVPYGHKKALERLGIPAGNIQEWEQTAEGLRESAVQTQGAINTFYGCRARGMTATDAFYADLSKVSPAAIKNKMVDISGEVKIIPVKRTSPIREFVEYHVTGVNQMPIGAAFYQLTKPEKVLHSDRLICIRDKSSGKVYAGQAARDLLALPKTGSIKLMPGDHGNYEIFIQSKSVNRKVLPGSSVMYWAGVAKYTC